MDLPSAGDTRVYNAIVEAIFEHEMFDARAGGASFGLEHVRKVEATWAYEATDIQATLESMCLDGLLEEDHAYWRATLAGLMARERRWQERGLRNGALSSGDATCRDRILAVTASGGYLDDGWTQGLRKQAILVYLLRESSQDVEKAIFELCEEGLTRWEDQFLGPTPVLLLTADGRRYYATKVVAQLGIRPPKTILSAVEPVKLPFEELGLPTVLADNLRYRWEEASRCVDARAWLAATALYGSILEVVIPDWLRRKSNGIGHAIETPNALLTDRRTLAELIKAAEQQGLIDSSLARHAQALRESRNLIHPDKNIRERSTPDANLAAISRQVVQAILDRIAALQVSNLPQ